MNWFKEPLLHFVLLGSLIFGVDFWLNGSAANDENKIVVTLRQQENLANTFERTWQRPPTQSETEALINDFIRQEIAYRESRLMQLDQDDIVIRRRLRQKLEMLAEDIASLTPPTEDEVRAYFADNVENFRQPAALSVHQIYFSNGDDPAAARVAALKLLEQLQLGVVPVDLRNAGSTSLLPAELDNIREPELDSMFGSGFAESIRGFEVGRWGGPVTSSFGLHLVRIVERIESALPEFEQVSGYVTREMLVERREKAIDGLYKKLAGNYEIAIEARADILPADVSDVTP